MNLSTEDHLKETLSPGRISTYERAVLAATGAQNSQLDFDLYLWNASIAGAYIYPLHIYEVALRNAISTAISNTYGANWPWRDQFIRSLSPKGIFSPQRELKKQNAQQKTTGKVIPELKFAFWEQMLKTSHKDRIWNPHFRTVFPFAPNTKSVIDCIHELQQNNYQIRCLRNRIAHHEPIFSRNLQDDYNKIYQAINWICKDTAMWMDNNQRVLGLLPKKPI